MIIQNKEVASLLLLECASTQNVIKEKITKELEDLSEMFSEQKFDNYLTRFETYLLSNKKSFFTGKKRVIRYLKGAIR